MKTYEEARDEAAERITGIEVPPPFPALGLDPELLSAFKKGSDFGKSFSDKQHDAEIKIKDDKISEAENWWKETCGDVEKLQAKLLAQDKIISVMEWALNIVDDCHWNNKSNYSIEDASSYVKKALTALKEHKESHG